MASNPATPWAIEKLNRQHDRAAFDCGNPLLDDWLKLRASQYEKKDLARTYVAIRPGRLARTIPANRPGSTSRKF